MQRPSPVIILKLDDLAETAPTSTPARPVDPRWQRCVDFLLGRGIRFSAGIIGYSLEDPPAAFVDWIKRYHAGGQIEFWNHGHYCRVPADTRGEFEADYATQLAALNRTQQLGREKLGIDFVSFGPHWTRMTADTDRAISAVPSLRIWMSGPDKPIGHAVSLQLPVMMEKERFDPDLPTVRARLLQQADAGYLMLQGHPPQWDEPRWARFVSIVDFLQAEGCRFMTPTEFVATRGG